MKSSLAIIVVSLLASQAAAQVRIADREFFKLELGAAEQQAENRWSARAGTEITLRAELAESGQVAVLADFGEPAPRRHGRGIPVMIDKLVNGGTIEMGAYLPPYLAGYHMVLRGYALTRSGQLFATKEQQLKIELDGVELPN